MKCDYLKDLWFDFFLTESMSTWRYILTEVQKKTIYDAECGNGDDVERNANLQEKIDENLREAIKKGYVEDNGRTKDDFMKETCSLVLTLSGEEFLEKLNKPFRYRLDEDKGFWAIVIAMISLVVSIV